MSKKVKEKPAGWFALFLGEARTQFELLDKAGGLVTVHPIGGGDELTIVAARALEALSKCGCGAEERKSCTCESFVYQDGKGVFYFDMHPLLVTMEAQGDRDSRVVYDVSMRFDERIATISV